MMKKRRFQQLNDDSKQIKIFLIFLFIFQKIEILYK
jgi:hypothetical protein